MATLVTLAEFQDALVLPAPAEGDQLAACLNVATQSVQNLTRGRVLASQTTFRRFDPPRAPTYALYLPQWPVTAISRLAFDYGSSGQVVEQTVWLSLPSAPDPGSPSDFDVLVRGDLDDITAANSRLELSPQRLTTTAWTWPWIWPPGPASIILESTAGYGDEAGEFPIPADLKNGVILLAADEYYRRFRSQWGTATLQLQGQTINYDTPQLFGLAMRHLAPYARSPWG